jgi:large subunit ribosomal protein L24
MKIKSGDNVIIIAGKDKGKSGKVRRAMPKENKVIVEGRNMVKRHMKPRGAGQPGGIIEKEAPLDISNVMILDNENKPSRVGYLFDETGKKRRIFRTTGQFVDQE